MANSDVFSLTRTGIKVKASCLLFNFPTYKNTFVDIHEDIWAMPLKSSQQEECCSGRIGGCSQSRLWIWCHKEEICKWFIYQNKVFSWTLSLTGGCKPAAPASCGAARSSPPVRGSRGRRGGRGWRCPAPGRSGRGSRPRAPTHPGRPGAPGAGRGRGSHPRISCPEHISVTL